MRAAELACLPADNEGVAAKLANIRDGKALAPVQLVRLKRGPLIVADATRSRPPPSAIGTRREGVEPALMVMALIYAIGGLSGAHLNPAVTLAFAVRGDFPPRRIASYVAAQAAGAILAALLLLAMYGNAGHLDATLPHLGSGTALVTEIVLTAALLLVILGTAASGPRLVGHNSALAVGWHDCVAGRDRQSGERRVDELSPLGRPRPRRRQHG